MTNFDQKSLIVIKQTINLTNGKSITVNGYQFPSYEAFGLRKFASECWVLSIAGRLVTFGSYQHIIDVIKLLVSEFGCCYHSQTSLIHFLQSPENSNVIGEIVTLRNIDHNP